VIGVGSTDSRDSTGGTSSRGPVINTGLIKPDISAPGLGIFSSSHVGPSKYQVRSGTSLAAPHVAGAIALMLEANPSLTFVDILWNLSISADRRNVTSGDLKCERPGRTQNYPNNDYGYGRLNIRKTIEGLKLEETLN